MAMNDARWRRTVTTAKKNISNKYHHYLYKKNTETGANVSKTQPDFNTCVFFFIVAVVVASSKVKNRFAYAYRQLMLILWKFLAAIPSCSPFAIFIRMPWVMWMYERPKWKNNIEKSSRTECRMHFPDDENENVNCEQAKLWQFRTFTVADTSPTGIIIFIYALKPFARNRLQNW